MLKSLCLVLLCGCRSVYVSTEGVKVDVTTRASEDGHVHVTVIAQPKQFIPMLIPTPIGCPSHLAEMP